MTIVQQCKGVLLANRIINKTDRTLHMYEETTGSVEHFEASNKKLVPDPRFNISHRSGEVFYVYTRPKFEQIMRSGRDLDDIAVLVENNATGRHNQPIDYLVWGKDLKTFVRYKKIHSRHYD